MNDHSPDCASHGASYSALTFSFLAGGLAGATVAVLLAPHSGKVSRAIMRRKLNDASESTRELKGRMVDRLNDVAESARELKDRRSAGAGKSVRRPQRLESAGSALAGLGPKRGHMLSDAYHESLDLLTEETRNMRRCGRRVDGGARGDRREPATCRPRAPTRTLKDVLLHDRHDAIDLATMLLSGSAATMATSTR